MEELQKELQKLQEEHNRLTKAKSYLLEVPRLAAEKQAAIEKELPGLLVSAALSETPDDPLKNLGIELRSLREIAKYPYQEAIKIIDNRIKPILGKIANIHHSQRLAENKASYQAARQAITAKGFYTVHELDELESLASNSGECRDCNRFKKAIDEYRSNFEQRGQHLDFPAFEYVPESLAV